MTLQFIRNKCVSKPQTTRQLPVAPSVYHYHHQPHHHQHNTSLPVEMPTRQLVRPAAVRGAGYQACQQEVTRFLETSSVPVNMRSRLMDRLSVRIPQNNDNMYKRKQQLTSSSHGLVNPKTKEVKSTGQSPVVNDLLKVAPPVTKSVWRPF